MREAFTQKSLYENRFINKVWFDLLQLNNRQYMPGLKKQSKMGRTTEQAFQVKQMCIDARKGRIKIYSRSLSISTARAII